MEMTIGKAIDMLNEKHCHPDGFHLFFVRDELLRNLWDVKENGRNLVADIMRQTYDGRFGNPDKPEYTMTLSAADVEVLWCALEVYNRATYTRHMEPTLKRMIETLGKGGS